jgi:hypothetical protein
MSVTTLCPHWRESSHSDGQDEPCHDGPICGGTPSMPGDDLDVTIAAGSIEAGALRVYLNVRRRANLNAAHSRELALKLLEAASWVENHSVD